MEPLYGSIRWTAGTLLAGLGAHHVVTGLAHLPASGPVIVASNHISYIDPFMLGLAVHRQGGRRVRFLAKQELFAHPFVGPLARGTRQIPVDRGGAAAGSLDSARAALGQAELVVVFPEGTITTSFVPSDFRPGAARLALVTGVPLVPAALWGGQRLFTKNQPRRYTRGVVLAVGFGPALHAGQDDDAHALTQRLQHAVTALVDELARDYPQGPTGPDDRWWLPRHLGGTAPTIEEASELRRREAEERRARRRQVAAKRAGRSG